MRKRIYNSWGDAQHVCRELLECITAATVSTGPKFTNVPEERRMNLKQALTHAVNQIGRWDNLFGILARLEEETPPSGPTSKHMQMAALDVWPGKHIIGADTPTFDVDCGQVVGLVAPPPVGRDVLEKFEMWSNPAWQPGEAMNSIHGRKCIHCGYSNTMPMSASVGLEECDGCHYTFAFRLIDSPLGKAWQTWKEAANEA